ncbi:MAG: twin-arginine translocase subunit TatC [Thermomicrobiales bacterium]
MSTIARTTGRVSGLAASAIVSAARSPSLLYHELRDVYRAGDTTPDVFTEMTLTEHLRELRQRIMTTVVALIPAFILGFYWARPILDDISVKANATSGMDVRSPTEPLMLTFKIALYVAVALGMPVIVYEFVAFLAPGMTRREKRVLFAALPFIAVLFLSGAGYGYFIAAPQALHFLSGWNTKAFLWQPDGPEIISFFMALMLGLGFAFQLPIIMFVLAKIGIVPTSRMRKWRRYAILVNTVAAAVITPSTDPFNMMLVAVPLYLLYELGIIISSAFAKTSIRSAAAAASTRT